MKEKQSVIRKAVSNDIKTIKEYDKHISVQELENSIALNRVYVAECENKFCGWLRYNLFWDNVPFMNMLYVLEAYRGTGIGKQLVLNWETEMRQLEYEMVLTSTVSNEYAQHFYNKIGYKSIGGFLLEEEPYEVIMSKRLFFQSD